MSAKCPRCGEEMTGGICDNCGFPLTKIKKKSYVKILITGEHITKRIIR